MAQCRDQENATPREATAPPREARARADKIENISSYVAAWASRDKSSTKWKFNKAKNLWLVKNARNRILVSKPMFKICLPYIASVEGGARERLVAQLEEDLNGSDDKKPLKEQLELIEDNTKLDEVA